MPYLAPSLQKTEEGQDVLLILQAFNVQVNMVDKQDLEDDMGHFDTGTNSVSLSAEAGREELSDTFVHESRHAMWHHLGTRADEFVSSAMSEEAYVAWEIIEEADTFAFEIEHEIHSRASAVHFLRDVYHEGYQEGVLAEFSSLNQQNTTPDPDLLDKAGKAQARKKLQEHIRDKMMWYGAQFLKYLRKKRKTLEQNTMTVLPDHVILALENHPRLQEILEDLRGMVERDLLLLADSIDIPEVEAEMKPETD
jgi:hypothetical protein